MYLPKYSINQLVNNLAMMCVAGLVVTTMSGCASAPKTKAPAAVIENRTGRSLRSVMYRPCGKDTAQWQSLLGTSLDPLEQVRIELPIECSDLMAEFNDGRVAGLQQNIKSRFPFHWVLQ